MRLAELSGLRTWLPQHPTAADQFWQRNPMQVSDMEIQLFYARAGLNGHHKQAVEAIDALQAAVILSVIEGELPEAPAALILHELPADSFLTDDLVLGLSRMRPARRQACLFALERSMTPQAVSLLTWKGSDEIHQLSPLCCEVLSVANQSRHPRLPYVFWEWVNPIIAAPLLELEESIARAFKMTWPALLNAYGRMVPLSSRADGLDMRQILSIQD